MRGASPLPYFFGESDIALNTEVLLQEPGGELTNTADPWGNVASVYVSYGELGLQQGDTFFGYALFPPDINASNDLVGLSDFPTNTGDRGVGGLDLIAGGVVFAREDLNLPPIARPDTIVTDLGIPVEIDVLDGDINGDGADSDPDNSPEPLSIDPDGFTFNNPEFGSTVTVDNQGTPDTTDDVVFYTPGPDFPVEGGVESFIYTITDGQDTATAEVTVTVNPPALTTVGGNVFTDTNGNDLFNPGAGEPFLPAITVNLIDADQTVVDTFETSPDGVYLFNDVASGEYTVQVDPADADLPPGAILGTFNDLPVNVETEPVTGINFGFDLPPVTAPDTATTTPDTPVAVNILENDTDDGTINPATVDLDPSTPEPDTTREVPGEGTYTVDPATGVVTFTPEAGFIGLSTINYTIQDNTGTPSAPAAITVTVNPPGTTSVSGNVFSDTDGEDDLDPGEAVLPTITVNLVDVSGNVVDTVETSADGVYLFNGVVPGDYTVQVDPADTDLPTGAILGTLNNIAVNVVANQPVTDINFGFDIPPVANPDSATTPFDTPVSFNITDNDTDDGTVDPTTVDLDPDTPEQQTERTVPGEGTYTVDPATGVVTFTPEPQFTGQSTINYTVQDNNGIPSAPAAITVTVNPPATTTVSGTVFSDTDGLDDLTPGEPLLSTITVNLIDAGGIVVDRVETDANGNYLFNGILPGDYTVQIDITDADIPAGAILGTPNNIPVTVAANQPVSDINFGFDPVPSSTTVSGAVFSDTDGGDDFDSGEPVLPTITVNLIDAGGIVVDRVETDANGNYLFNGILPGDYTVQIDITDADIPAGATLGTPNNIAVSVAANQAVSDINFGFDIPPVANPDSATTLFNTPVSFNITDNDTDDGTIDPTTVDLNPSTPELDNIRTIPEEGAYTVDETGSVTFTPEPAFIGPSTINYTVQDNTGTPSAPVPITVTVNPPLGFPVSGSVFSDIDNGDDLDPDEPPLPAIEVSLINSTTQEVVDTVETDPQGNYSIVNVPDGQYFVRVNPTDPQLPIGLTLGTPNDLPITVVGQPVVDNNFGFDPAPLDDPIDDPTPILRPDPIPEPEPIPEPNPPEPEPEFEPTPPIINGPILRESDENNIQIGSNDSEILRGSPEDDIQFGLSSNDNINGSQGNDSQFGNQGDDFIEGGTGNDVLFGGQDNDTLEGQADGDTLFGNLGNDQLYGGDNNDLLFGNQGDDIVKGGEGNDSAYGGRGNDTLEGESGDDAIWGDRGNDVLSGVDPNAVNAGRSEIDSLTGGLGNDTFILGDEIQVYYDDGDGTNLGLEDYTLIQDFDTNQDQIQLKGEPQDYRLDTQPEGLPDGTALYRTVNGEDELIAIIPETPLLSLEADYFSFVV